MSMAKGGGKLPCEMSTPCKAPHPWFKEGNRICCWKFCCPCCAVAYHEGIGGPWVASVCCGYLYTLLCWKPK